MKKTCKFKSKSLKFTTSGFTLIELLAVIVILAIIALIAIPIVLNIISDVNKNSTEVSMKNIDKAASLYFQQNRKEQNIIFECSKGICKYNNEELELNGKSPESGKILIDKKGNITYEDIVLNGFNCYEEHDKFICDIKKIRKTYTQSKIVINSESEYKLFDYNIYGNSVQNAETLQYESVGDKTVNLLDVPKELEFTQFYKVNCNIPAGTYKITYDSFSSLNPDGLIGEPYLWFVGSRKGIYLLKSSNYVTITLESDNTEIFFYAYGYNYDNSANYNVNIENLMIISEDIQQIKYEPYNKYKIPVKVSGKNILDVENMPVVHNNAATPGYRWERTTTGFKGSFINESTGTSFRFGWIIGATEDFKGKNITISYGEAILNEGADPIVAIALTKKPGILNKSFDESMSFLGKGYIGTLNDFSSIKLATASLTVSIPLDADSETFPYIAVYFFLGSYSENPANSTFEYKNIQVEINDVATDYKPYYNKVTNIYLDEPLRSYGEKSDYIDFKNSKVIRYIEEDSLGNLKVLSVPKEEKIELPEILLKKGINNIEIETSIKPSKVELEYYK